jgi:hypothetical protein
VQAAYERLARAAPDAEAEFSKVRRGREEERGVPRGKAR